MKALMKIEHKLDLSVDFQAIQMLADRDAGQDVLGSEGGIAFKHDWTKIQNYLIEAKKNFTDARLDVLEYRSALNLRSLAASLKVLSSLDVQINDSEFEKTSHDEQQMFNALFYYFSKLHLQELRSAYLDEERSFLCSDLIAKSQAGQSKDSESDELGARIQTWATQNHDFLDLIDKAIQSLTVLSNCLDKHNSIGVTLETPSLIKWLLKLQEALIHFGAKQRKDDQHSLSLVPEVSDAHSYGANFMELENSINTSKWDRGHVDKLLSEISVWFETNEPTHPAPYFIKRIQKMMGSDFLSVLQELLPESVGQFEQMTGRGKSQ
jgi:type VI secretion system protein ImpA